MLTVKEVKNFKDEQECIEYLEAKRWNGKPVASPTKAVIPISAIAPNKI